MQRGKHESKPSSRQTGIALTHSDPFTDLLLVFFPTFPNKRGATHIIWVSLTSQTNQWVELVILSVNIYLQLLPQTDRPSKGFNPFHDCWLDWLIQAVGVCQLDGHGSREIAEIWFIWLIYVWRFGNWHPIVFPSQICGTTSSKFCLHQFTFNRPAKAVESLRAKKGCTSDWNRAAWFKRNAVNALSCLFRAFQQGCMTLKKCSHPCRCFQTGGTVFLGDVLQ